jgi:hypothetical protein
MINNHAVNRAGLCMHQLSGTLAKEKLNMSKLIKIVIASVLAVAVTGPAAAAYAPRANPPIDGEYVGDKLKAKLSLSACKNFSENKNVAKLRFTNNNNGFSQSGNGYLEGFTIFGDLLIDFQYTEKKVDKELTLAILNGDVGSCFTPEGAPHSEQICSGIVGFVQDWLDGQNCGVILNAQSAAVVVNKSRITFSKDQTRAKADIRVEGEYVDDNLKSKKWTFMIKSTNMDFVPVANGVN